MPEIQVARLRLRCPPERREQTRFAVEDGLRTTIPDDRRLVLVRKMQVRDGVDTASPAQRQDAVRTGWLAAIANARHGADDGAADANCVWFASLQEAETLLLARLLAGRAVDAWYWRLALPDWRGRPLTEWVAGTLRKAIAGAEHQRLLAIARCFVAAGAAERLVGIILRLCGTADQPDQAVRTNISYPLVASHPRPPVVIETQVAEALAEAVARELGTVILKLEADGEGRPVARAIIGAWLLKRSPALALSSELAAASVNATMAALAARGRAPTPAAKALEPRPPSPRAAPRSGEEKLAADPQLRHAPGRRRRPGRGGVAGAEPVRRSERQRTTVPSEAGLIGLRRLHSGHSGLWLVVPSLTFLGFREWLAERPALLAGNPGGRLLREIARHHYVPNDDPALSPLAPPIESDVTPEWCRLWRHGLDRWLRRLVRRRLHDLVHRPGELVVGEQSLMIHYPGTDADLALRRRALDRDPGWTDWLGLSVRYCFGGSEDWL